MAVTGTARIFGLLASLVRTVASVIGGLIIVHAVFVLFGANPHNVLVQFTAGIRDSFGWFTKNLFQPSDKKIAEAINDALAGFIWVFLGSVAAKFVARLAPASSGKDKSSKKKDDTPRSTPVQRSLPEKAKDEPKQEAPARQEAPRDEARTDDASKDDASKDTASKAKAAKDDLPRYDAPENERPEQENPDRHQATETARADEPAGDRAGDKAQA